MSRFREVWSGYFPGPRTVFVGNRRLTSFTVRAEQIAPHLDGFCLRSKYLRPERLDADSAVIWIADAVDELVDRTRVPQILDVINPLLRHGERFVRTVNRFPYLILNTPSSLDYIPCHREEMFITEVIPHHHCNVRGYRLSEARLERPQVVGYVGQPEHLHETERIKARVEALGLRFVSAWTRNLSAYEEIDIGVAWTNPELFRDRTRSNIKFTNFIAHGIPSVCANYESYREVERQIGGGGAFAETIEQFLDELEELIRREEKRRHLASFAAAAFEGYRVEAIAMQTQAFVQRVMALAKN